MCFKTQAEKIVRDFEIKRPQQRQRQRFVRINVTVAFQSVDGAELGVFYCEGVLFCERLNDRETRGVVSGNAYLILAVNLGK